MEILKDADVYPLSATKIVLEPDRSFFGGWNCTVLGIYVLELVEESHFLSMLIYELGSGTS